MSRRARAKQPPVGHIDTCALVWYNPYPDRTMNNNELNDLIRQASPPPDFPTSFQREVWQRIALSESRSRHSCAGRHLSEVFSWLMKPAAAAITVAIVLVVGAGLGKLVSARDAKTNSRAAYAASINPILSAHGAFER